MRTLRRILAAAFVLAAVVAIFSLAPSIRADTSRNYPYLSALNKIEIGSTVNTAPATDARYWMFKTPGQLWDFMCTQVTAGTSGTDVNFDIQKNGTTMLSTLGQIPIGAGADKSIDAHKDITAVASAVRPVLKTTPSSIRVAKGDKIAIITTEDGSYSPHPTYRCVALFVPDE